MSQLKARLQNGVLRYLALFGALLLLLFYLTSQLSKNSILDDTALDFAIYTIYLFLVLVVGSMGYLVYLLFDETAVVQTSLYENESPARQPLVSEEAEAAEENKPQEDLESYRPLFQQRSLQTEGFELLRSLSQDETITLLRAQHPQLSVLLLMQRDDAVLLLQQLPDTVQQELDTCMQESSKVDVSVLKRVAEGLEMVLSRPKEACELLSSLDAIEVRELLRHVTKRELIFALQHSDQELQERFLANMSEVTAERFKKALRLNDAVYRPKSHNALKKLYLLAKQLREDGKISASNQVTG